MRSLHLIKYVLVLFLAAAMPIDVAKWVLPTPLKPRETMFSLRLIKRNVSKSIMFSLLI